MGISFVPEKAQWRCRESMNDRGLTVSESIRVYRGTSTTFVDPIVVQRALGAQLGLNQFSTMDVDPDARLKDASTVFDPEKSDPWIYTTTLTYSSDTPSPDQSNRQNDDPLDDAAEVEIDGEVVLFPAFKDRDGKLIANAAYEPITGINEERSIEICTVTRNEVIRNSARDRLYRNALNKFTYAGADPWTLKITRIRATLSYRNGIKFWRYFYEIRYNPDGWQPKALNAGRKQYVPSPTIGFDKIDCVDSDGQPANDPVPLDADGKQIPESDLPDAANYLTFKTLKEADFALLSFPSIG